MLPAFRASRYRILALVVTVTAAPATLATADAIWPSHIRTQSMPPIPAEGYGKLSAPDTGSGNVRTVKVRPQNAWDEAPPPDTRDQETTTRAGAPSGSAAVPDHQVFAPSRSAPQDGFQAAPR